ncbi:hypothetical protein UFVDC4_00123 [Staphylococcus phage vB_SauM-UFV_DC4]|nr:hypothetical protein UFVDC4_00123 [Staphylococcus phage vB_SauM-UFV_DC4]
MSNNKYIDVLLNVMMSNDPSYGSVDVEDAFIREMEKDDEVIINLLDRNRLNYYVANKLLSKLYYNNKLSDELIIKYFNKIVDLNKNHRDKNELIYSLFKTPKGLDKDFKFRNRLELFKIVDRLIKDDKNVDSGYNHKYYDLPKNKYNNDLRVPLFKNKTIKRTREDLDLIEKHNLINLLPIVYIFNWKMLPDKVNEDIISRIMNNTEKISKISYLLNFLDDKSNRIINNDNQSNLLMYLNSEEGITRFVNELKQINGKDNFNIKMYKIVENLDESLNIIGDTFKDPFKKEIVANAFK